jgi:hypothetical protein
MKIIDGAVLNVGKRSGRGIGMDEPNDGFGVFTRR